MRLGMNWERGSSEGRFSKDRDSLIFRGESLLGVSLRIGGSWVEQEMVWQGLCLEKRRGSRDWM